ncbi:SKI/DACH domain-containing protein 1-like [Oncorhynchus kisutch]|uniref:SKI/DACH domain-containing protein 1-like n=1 Tax=Oncorhynchus kisutch TaxID=8019 RepID=UPI0009A06FCD|nr:SKI/DACH domain-containing protein 1-like [Oncorhynchus kisutch]
MGDLKFGFEEMQGVRLGYLLIKGKQMFALSQVFTDLLKNIPRTTVHKRMDHLNVKKHHCDLEELRKLKAINSIAFHAAKCTLISREDVEALYFSCKTERVLKSNKRKAKKASLPEGVGEGKLNADTHPAGLWRDKVWLSLHSVPQTKSLKNKAGRREQPTLRPDSNLPQIYNKSLGRDYSSVTKSSCKPFKNYETGQIPSNCVAFSQGHSFFRSVVSRQPVLFQSAIAAQSRLSATGDLLHKRKRRREGGGGRDMGSSGARQSWSRSRHTHSHTYSHTHHPVLLVQPKCCRKPKTHYNHNRTTLSHFDIGHEFYLDHHDHHHRHPHQHVGGFPESYSSDTESSCYSERLNNDSDIGSSLSTSSNSGTSDEEDEDESPLESSEVSSDEESSSQSDSSSVSSQVSVQSIRFRRARFPSLNTTKNITTRTLPNAQSFSTTLSSTRTLPNAQSLSATLSSTRNQSNSRTLSNSRTISHTNAPLLLQPTFHYSHQQQPSKPVGQFGTSQVDYDIPKKQPKYDFTAREAKQDTHTHRFSSPVTRGSYFTKRRDRKVPESQVQTQREIKRTEPVSRKLYALSPSPNPNGIKAVLPHRTTGHANKCPPVLSSHSAPDKDTKYPKPKNNKLSLATNLQSEVRISPNLKLPFLLKTIKTEPEELSVAAGPLPERSRAVKTPPFNLQNVKIKVEESYDEYEYYSQASGFQCLGDEADINNGQYYGGDIKQAAGCFNNETKAIESSAGAPKSSSGLQECGSTQDTPCPEEGEYKNGAGVRKNYRSLVLGKKPGISRMQQKQNVSKVDRTLSSRPVGKAEICEGNTEDLTGATKRKRASSNVAAPLKRPFSFMANFPAPPSLLVGSDGDLSPAYSLNSLGGPRPPPRSHPVWRWQPGGLPVPPPPTQKIRKCSRFFL